MLCRGATRRTRDAGRVNRGKRVLPGGYHHPPRRISPSCPPRAASPGCTRVTGPPPPGETVRVKLVSEAAVAKHHTPNGLHSTNVFSRRSGGQKFRIALLAGRRLGHAPSAGLREGSVPGPSPGFWWPLGWWQQSSTWPSAFSLRAPLCLNPPPPFIRPVALESGLPCPRMTNDI